MPSRGAATAERQVARQEIAGRCPPPLPPPSEKVRAVLHAGVVSRRMLFPENGHPRSVEEWRAPAIIDKAVGMAVWSRLTELEAHLIPAPRAELMSRILVLLAHYRSATHAAAVEQGLADDWADDLAAYPMWAVDNAARTWRRTMKFRPQVSEIIALCEDVTGEMALERQRLQSVVDAATREANPLEEEAQTLARGLLRRVGQG